MGDGCAIIELGPVRVVCEVARTAAEQAQGLQGYESLVDGAGMLFPFAPPRAAQFHMGCVRFPIDIVFVDGGLSVAHIVEDAQPGAHDRWSWPIVAAVVEVPGGFCRRQRVMRGAPVRLLGTEKRAVAQTYNLLRTLTEASTSVDAAAEPLGPGYYGHEPQHTPPGGARDEMPEGDRFKDHGLPDTAFSEANDQAMPHWEEGFGYQRPRSNDPVYPVRSGGLWKQRLTRRLALEIRDPSSLAVVLLEAAQRSGVTWSDVPLNDRIQQAKVTPADVGRWLHKLGLGETERDAAFDAVTTLHGMELIGKAFLASGFADLVRTVMVGDEPTLVLTRGRV